MNGKWWMLNKGEDFKCSVMSVRNAARMAARTIGKRVQTRVSADKTVIYIRAIQDKG